MTPAETEAAIVDATHHWMTTTGWAVIAIRCRAWRAYQGDFAIWRHANYHAKYGSRSAV